MNALLTPIPLLYRIAAIAGLVLAVFGFGWLKGAEHGQVALDKLVAKQVTEGVKLARAREVITTKVETKYVPQIAKAGVITETILKEIPVYVPPNAAACAGVFRVFHDAAAQGLVPDPARIADAAPVSAEDASATVVENYGECRADQLRLQGLQEWATEQLRLNPP